MRFSMSSGATICSPGTTMRGAGSLVAAGADLKITGVYDARTNRAVRAYRTVRKLPGYQTTDAAVWAELQRGQTL